MKNMSKQLVFNRTFLQGLRGCYKETKVVELISETEQSFQTQNKDLFAKEKDGRSLGLAGANYDVMKDLIAYHNN